MKKIYWSNSNFNNSHIFKFEFERFFDPPSFIGVKQLMNNNNYCVLKHFSERYILTKTNDFNLLRNCCLHKNAKLIDSGDKESKKNIIICPVHCWTYNFNGELLNAPLSNFNCKNSNLTIKELPELFNLKGLILSDSSLYEEIKESKFLEGFDLENYSIFNQTTQKCDGDWKEYGIVYNDSNHVRFFHQEMFTVLNVESTEWEFGKNYTSHRQKIKPNWKLIPENNFTKFFKNLEIQYPQIKSEANDDYVVTFVNIYPNIFIDIWRGVVDIGIINPIDENNYELHTMMLCRNEMIDDSEILSFYKGAIDRVGDEDTIITSRITQGRKNKSISNDIYEEYINDFTEEGDLSYIEWISNKGKDFYIGDFRKEDL